MFSVISFILKCVAQLISLLFSINLGNGLSLGLLMCFCFILLPITHRVLCFIRQDAVDELNDSFIQDRKTRNRSNKKGRG